MKLFLIASLSLIAVSAFAEENLTDMKHTANERIDKQIATLNEAKSCVNSATTKDKFKSCKYDLHEGMKMQKMEMNKMDNSMDSMKKDVKKSM